MKLVNRETFLTLPAGTMFRQYEEAGRKMGPILIKGETQPETDGFSGDWNQYTLDSTGSSNVSWPMLDQALADGTEFRFEYVMHVRDGEYDWDQLYAVYDKQDVAALLTAIVKLTGVRVPSLW